jgi:16S rRNA (guanine527-N7)-methyltransferase
LSDRLSVHAAAIAEVRAPEPDHVICRAFASLGDFVAGIERRIGRSSRVWAMKGRYPEDEVAALAPPWHIVGAHEIRVPGLDAQRHLLELSRNPIQMEER